MPWKKQAACILLITYLGVSGLVGAVTRTYHIGIVEEYWDYVPQGKNIITGKSFAEDKWVSMGSPETPRFGFLFIRHVEGCIPWVVVMGVSWCKLTGGVLRLLGKPSLDGCAVWKRRSSLHLFAEPSIQSLVCEEPQTQPGAWIMAHSINGQFSLDISSNSKKFQTLFFFF